jgi:hypothetical protein
MTPHQKPPAKPYNVSLPGSYNLFVVDNRNYILDMVDTREW